MHNKTDLSCRLVWNGKEAAAEKADTPQEGRLSLCEEKSINPENTENIYIYIEGDNLAAMKLMLREYRGLIGAVYIDPPYNTGSGFVYSDPRLPHCDWLNMIYPRLMLAKQLLAEDGVMFISIDDYEIDNLKLACSDIFGSENVEVMVWHKVGYGDAGAGKMKISRRFRCEHEYIVVCYKNAGKVSFCRVNELPNFKNSYGNPDNDPRGPYKTGNISKTEGKSNENGKNFYAVTSPDGEKTYRRQWHFDRRQFELLQGDNRIYWGKSGHAVPGIKIFLNEPRKVVPASIIKNAGSAASANKKLERLMGGRYFENPKPVELIEYLLSLIDSKELAVLDFFSGSATTAHAVMNQNAKDGGSRRFIMIQEPESCGENSEAYKNGFQNICEIGRRRIILAGEEPAIKKSAADTGFKTFCVELP